MKEFPDVNIFFEFDSIPSDKCLEELQSEVYKFREKFKTVFVHNMRMWNGRYVISINHNTIDFDTYSEKNYQKDVQHFDYLLSNIDKNPLVTHLTYIKFE